MLAPSSSSCKPVPLAVFRQCHPQCGSATRLLAVVSMRFPSQRLRRLTKQRQSRRPVAVRTSRYGCRALHRGAFAAHRSLRGVTHAPTVLPRSNHYRRAMLEVFIRIARAAHRVNRDFVIDLSQAKRGGNLSDSSWFPFGPRRHAAVVAAAFLMCMCAPHLSRASLFSASGPRVAGVGGQCPHKLSPLYKPTRRRSLRSSDGRRRRYDPCRRPSAVSVANRIRVSSSTG